MKYHNQQFVRWDDIDAFGHVNNAKYLTYAQEARFQWSWFESAKRETKPTIVEMVVARAEVDFIVPIYAGGTFVDVHLWVDSVGTSSFTLSYEISSQGIVHARAKTVQVAVSLKTKKSRPLTDAEREFLKEFME